MKTTEQSCQSKSTDMNSHKSAVEGKIYGCEMVFLEESVVKRLEKYDLNLYISDVENIGLENTWERICQFALDNGNVSSKFLNVDNFGQLYEIGLALQDKQKKKKSGQYYTPDDVALIMSQWFDKCKEEVVCDVACGTGKLILTYLDYIGYEKARKLISEGKLYLYDIDTVALKICNTILAVKYGLDIANLINDICGDFLDENVKLPNNCKVICNPPYSRLDNIPDCWHGTDVLADTKEYYAAFMEKVFAQAESTVIITPFSFISGAKFYSLRKKMCDLGYGFIVAFDNVPGNVFCGRKQGIFNTNTANSVRAAITVVHKNANQKGYKVSHLIRFKNEQRKDVLKCDVLENLLSDEYQKIGLENETFKKIDKNLSTIYYDWTSKSDYRVKDVLSETGNGFLINMPNTCRYFTTASTKKLNRNGLISLYVKDETAFDFLYCFINSSFTYWWWRIYDGGITYPVSLLNEMPLPINLLTDDDKFFFKSMRNKLSAEERKYMVCKINAGSAQENIKFPVSYRNEINRKILEILGHAEDGSIFDNVHANSFIKE